MSLIWSIGLQRWQGEVTFRTIEFCFMTSTRADKIILNLPATFLGIYRFLPIPKCWNRKS